MRSDMLAGLEDATRDISGPPGNQSDQAYAAIEELIATLRIPPGQVLTEQGLAAQLGFGRTPVREALQRLEREALVLIEPRRGAVVTQLDVKRQLQMLEVRRYLERYLASAAARRATSAEREEFTALSSAMRRSARSGDAEAFLKLDKALNRLLLQAARNGFAEAVMLPFQALSRRFWFAHYRTAKNFRQTCLLHAELAYAIASGDALIAEQKANLLLDNVEAFTRASLDSDLTPAEPD
jgi:DNA-binding GntR family transcriptional regulator